MSATTPTTAHGGSAQAADRAHGAAGRKPGAGQGNEAGTDRFALMLSLLSASSDILPDAADLSALPADGEATDAAPDLGAAEGATLNPLAALLGWPGAPQPLTPLATGNSALAAKPPSPTDPATAPADWAGSPLSEAPPLATVAVTGPATATDPTQPAIDLQGMQRVDRPATPDEQALAAAARRDGGGEAPTRPSLAPAAGVDNASANAPSAPRPTAWRSTATGVTTTTGVQQQNAHQSLNERLQVRLEAAAPMALRSTVTLDERFQPAPSASEDTASPLAAWVPAGATTSGADAQAGGQPGAGDPSGHEPQDRLSSEAESTDEARYEDTLAEADSDEGLGTWGAPTLRQASLRVGEAGEDAIDIQLSMTGQDLNIAFRTDSADARAELRQNAGESLADLLQRSGIQLGDVSVGAQNPQQQRGEPDPGQTARQASNTAGGGEAASDVPTAATPPQPPRSDGSRPLDLFV